MDPYQITIGGVKADPYRIAKAYGIDDPIIFQAIKKLLRCGRKHKSMAQDVREAITSLERWEEIEAEDTPNAAGKSLSNAINPVTVTHCISCGGEIAARIVTSPALVDCPHCGIENAVTYIPQQKRWKPGWNKFDPQGDEPRPKSTVLQPPAK